MAVQIAVKQAEAKTFRFTVRDTSGDLVDIYSATLSYKAKRSKLDSDFIFTKANVDFTHVSLGIATVPMSSTDLSQSPDVYKTVLKIIFGSANKDKSVDIDLTIERAVDPD